VIPSKELFEAAETGTEAIPIRRLTRYLKFIEPPPNS
jgi:hypothetical protein